MNWFYSNDGVTRHEVDAATFGRLVREGVIAPETLVWRDGLAQWVPARAAAPEYFVGQEAPPPAPAGEMAPPPPPAPTPFPAAPVYGLPATGPAGFAPVVQRDAAALTSCITGSIAAAGGLLGFCCCFGAVVTVPLGIVAVSFGHPALTRAKQPDAAPQDKTLATVGLVTGYLAIALGLGVVLFHLLFIGLGSVSEGLKTGLGTP